MAAAVSTPTAAVAASTAAASASAVSASTSTAPAPESTAKTSAALTRARSLYFAGDALKSAEAYEAAVKASSTDWRGWAEGAVVWSEVARPEKAVEWLRKAAALDDRTEVRASLGWALLRAAEPEAADAEFSRALAADKGNAWALLGAGRAKLALDKPGEAVDLLRKAALASPGQSLADFYIGMAYEKLGDDANAAEAYKRAVGADSYFHEGRSTLARSYLRQRRYNDAWRQLSKLVEADPGSKLARAMLEKVRPLITRTPEPGAPPGTAPAAPPAATKDTEPWGDKMPALRIGVSSTPMGKPRARVSATIHGNVPWQAIDPKSGRTLLSADEGDSWTIRRIPANKKKKKSRTRLEFHGPDGLVAAVPGDVVLIRPSDLAKSAITLEDDPDHSPRAFRGELEFALFNGRRTIRVVNILGLEDYTHGVVSSEMPNRAPLEALKAQAVVARTHAYFIKTVTKRHRHEGYDICDEQHCQVYGGLRAETDRTRAVVEDTRGRVATYKGQPAHVIYSSHCGGRTQSGTDLGWGDVPYWKSVSDAATPQPLPTTPIELRRLLSDWPKGFDRPSQYVHPAHARWTRAVPAKDLEERLNRKYKIGKLKGLRVLKRAASGNVDALLVVGSKRNKKMTDELDIRSMLATGSLRSTFFVLDVEYRKEAAPAPKAAKGKKPGKAPPPTLVPETFVFRGGGWGHAVGMCQSGAMGRAEAGQDYAAIIKGYFTGVEMGNLAYRTVLYP